ncbi:radical SAM additional 4Fe4S-binding SPASM domain-containing protein [Butyrivibrio fibrisolvens]|uniref:Radical SAM additional 4Fe4S-binding SPASM domain-containing protein n=1 Tax=Butyrivibrio fibrisolvens TaxID=831 RepID=A0A1H9X6E0_BUTFI|nr:radical SAM protein [Butyrivibrio fibrisolvens]SES41649.1 radical SAM additional 4Fe4S-binding SPASM domain-containing protein [Butyrivibrio fibrisolvens]
MISTPKNIRVTQTRDNNEFLLYNSISGEEYNIDATMLEVLKEVEEQSPQNREELLKIVSNMSTDSEEIVDFMFEEEIWKSVEEKNSNIHDVETNLQYPLTTLTIELTNLCTLNCIHCYGKFGHNKIKHEYSLKEIVELKKQMDKLSVRTVVLTGGDAFLNHEIIKIAKFFLENGFKVTVLSNGWNDISLFCEELSGYAYSIAFSIDGLEDQHDYIRGRKQSFTHVLKALEIANRYQNVATKVNITVMKKNIHQIDKLIEYLKSTFPNTSINAGLIIPVGDNDIDFKEDEFERLEEKCPWIFEKFIKDKDREERCFGGVSLCSLDAQGNVTICTAAREKDFILGNIRDRSLYDIWMKPSPKIERMRKEFHQNHEKCKECANKRRCKKVQDCRVYALKYTGDMDNPSPICCYVASKEN